MRIFVFFCVFLFVQQNQFVKTKEFLVKKYSERYFVSSSDTSTISFFHKIDREKNFYTGIDFDFSDLAKAIHRIEFNPPFVISDISNDGYLSVLQYMKKKWVYSVGVDDDAQYFQKVWIQIQNKDYYLDSIYNADKHIHSSFSSDGRYLLVNTLNTLSDYYNPEQDNRIMVYDLENIINGEISKEYIPCHLCGDSYKVNEKLFFTIGKKDAYDGYDEKDIYFAPWSNPKDTVKIAAHTKIKAVSSDGRYVLGTRFWDRQQTTTVIIDVEQKKYQMLLGRNYADHKAFYSSKEGCFAFDFKGYLIYVDMPELYPFDALKWKNEEIPLFTDKEFWKKYEHEPLQK